MSEDNPKIGDLLGVKPVAEAVEKITSATIQGAQAVLNRICLPAAEELGLLLRDRVSYWRAKNLITMTRKLEQKLTENKVPEGFHAHPRLVHSIMDQGAWSDDSAVQDLWAGLLSSSCTEAGDDDSNLMFVTLLSNLTRLQANILRYICEQSQKLSSPSGLIQARPFHTTVESLQTLTGERDIQRLDRELDHLRAASLILGGLDPHSPVVDLTPTPLALHMYVRCQGSRLSPTAFFELTPATAQASPQQGSPEQKPN